MIIFWSFYIMFAIGMGVSLSVYNGKQIGKTNLLTRIVVCVILFFWPGVLMYLIVEKLIND